MYEGILSSPWSMKARTSSMRMSPSCFRLARATRSRSDGGCSTRLSSSICFLQSLLFWRRLVQLQLVQLRLIQLTDRADHACRLPHHQVLGKGTFLDPPECELR